jgi:HK97 family phage prohead protease
MAKSIERRMAVQPVELRESGDGVTLVGYASTFNQPYDMGWYRETVHPDAFKRSLGQKPDVRLLINHGGLPLARTTSGTLSLDTDASGLRVSAQLDASDPDVAAILPKMRRGDLNQMSFGFRLMGDDGDEWSKDMTQRTLRTLDINDGDVSVVTYPANPNARVGVRSDGLALDAVASALRCMETRSASAEDITSILTRALAYFNEARTVAEIDGKFLTVEEARAIVNTQTPEESAPIVDESARAAMRAAFEARQRAVRLLG